MTVTSNENVTVSSAAEVSAGGLSPGGDYGAGVRADSLPLVSSWARAGAATTRNTANTPIKVFNLFAKIVPSLYSEPNEERQILSFKGRHCTD